MSKTDITQEQAEAFMRELTELSKKHGIWIDYHYDCTLAYRENQASYDWRIESGPNGDCITIGLEGE